MFIAKAEPNAKANTNIITDITCLKFSRIQPPVICFSQCDIDNFNYSYSILIEQWRVPENNL